MSKPPPPALTARAVGPCPTVIKIVGRPGTGSLPSTFAPPDHPQFCLNYADIYMGDGGFGYIDGQNLIISDRVTWLVGCFGFNGPLRQYFSLYRAVSQREGVRGKKG